MLAAQTAFIIGTERPWQRTVRSTGMNWLAMLLAIAAGLITPGCAEPQSKTESALGGKRVLDTIKHADRIEAYRLRPQFVDDSAHLLEEDDRERTKASDYEVVGDAVDVPDDIAKRFAAILDAPESYLWDMASGCVPDYGVRLSFVRDSERVDVLFCLECDLLSVFRNDRARGGADFSPAHGRLVAEFKKLFPDDRAIQGLSP